MTVRNKQDATRLLQLYQELEDLERTLQELREQGQTDILSNVRVGPNWIRMRLPVGIVQQRFVNQLRRTNAAIESLGGTLPGGF